MAPRRVPAIDLDAAGADGRANRRDLPRNPNHPPVNKKGLMKEEKPRGKGKGRRKSKVEIRTFKDPNLPDFDVIVLNEKHRVSNQAINRANELWIAHQNKIRERRNAYIETFTSSIGKSRDEKLELHALEFAKLKDEVEDVVAAVKSLGGTPAPFPIHLEDIPRPGNKQSIFRLLYQTFLILLSCLL